MGLGYELGSIVIKKYQIDRPFVDIDIYEDINELITLYDKIPSILNGRTIAEWYNYVEKELNGTISLKVIEEDFNANKLIDFSQNISSTLITDIPQEKPVLVKDDRNTARYPRNPAVARNALVTAKFKCEIDAYHPSFLAKDNINFYVETHHLVPLSQQDHFLLTFKFAQRLVIKIYFCWLFIIQTLVIPFSIIEIDVFFEMPIRASLGL